MRCIILVVCASIFFLVCNQRILCELPSSILSPKTVSFCFSSKYILNEPPVAWVKISCYFLLLQRQSFIRKTARVFLGSLLCLLPRSESRLAELCCAGQGRAWHCAQGDRWSYMWSSWRSRVALPQQGPWQLTSLAPTSAVPRWDSGTDFNRTGHPGVNQTGRLFLSSLPAVSPFLLPPSHAGKCSHTTLNRYLSQ